MVGLSTISVTLSLSLYLCLFKQTSLSELFTWMLLMKDLCMSHKDCHNSGAGY